MRKSRLVVALVCAPLLLAVPTVWAQDGDGPRLAWKEVAEAPGVEVIRLWEMMDAPPIEHALLRLTDARKKELMESPSGFVNRYNVFSADVQPLATCVEQKLPDAPKGTSDLKWIASYPHWPNSKGLCSVFLVSPSY